MPLRRSYAARRAKAHAGAVTRRRALAHARPAAPRLSRARARAAPPRGSRARGGGRVRTGQARDMSHPAERRIRQQGRPPRSRAGGARVPSTRRRCGEAARRTPTPSEPARRRAADRCTPHTGEPATRSASRTARTAAARSGATPSCSRRRRGRRAGSRPDSAAAAADRARLDSTSTRVPRLCQFGEYSARSGRPTRLRMRLSASSSCCASPMSYHSPGKRYA
jgi:hypothetical protein